MNYFLRFLMAALLLPVLLDAAATQAQTLTFNQAVACASGDGYGGYGGWGPITIVVDAQGNTYVAGRFNGTIVLGSTFLNATQTYMGNTLPYDNFVAKLDPAGNYLWAVQLGDNQAASVGGLAVDAAGDVYLTGAFYSYSLRVGAGGPLLFNSSASDEAFVAKFSGSSGQTLWARRAGGTDSDGIRAVAINVSGEVYVLGDSRSTVADFGAYTLATPIGSFVAKLSPGGTWLWVRPVGNARASVTDLLLDTQGGLYLGGVFRAPSVSFGSTTLTTQGVPGSSYPTTGSEFFVAKTDDAGTWHWAVQGDAVTHLNLIKLFSMALDGSGHLYVGGSYASTAARVGTTVLPNLSSQLPQPNPLPPVPYTNNYYTDAFVARLNAATGTWEWAVRSGNQYNEVAQRLVADTQGRIYATGLLTNAPLGSQDWQLAQLDGATGAWRSVQALAPLGIRALALDGQSRLHVAGYFESTTAQVGPVTLAQAGPGRQTGFVARMSAGPLAAQAPTLSAAGLAVWPNPSGRGAVWVQGPAPGLAVQVLDALGRVVANSRMPAAGGPLALLLPPTLPAGLYLVHSAGQARRLVIE